MQRILLIEDHLAVSQMIAQVCSSQYKLTFVRTLREAYQQLKTHRFHLLIIDLHLPDGEGLELVRYMHETQVDVPLIILSNRVLTQDRIVGFRTGADDYLTKPFASEELLLRVESLLHKTKKVQINSWSVGDLEIIPENGQILQGKRKIHLRKKECDILSFLAKHKNTIISREKLIGHIWCSDDVPTYKTVDVYVRRIRQLLGGKRKMLQTVRGYGYVLREN